MKPFKILLFVFAIIIVLGFVMLIFPKDGIKVNNDLTIKFTSFQELFFQKKVEYADISDLLNLGLFNLDSLDLSGDSDSAKVDTFRVSADSLKQVVYKLQFADSNKTALHPFFKKLKNRTEVIHVMHYGDSQIEGDRITGIIRNHLQSRYGGYGIGVIPAVEINNVSVSITQSASDNWQRYTVFGKKDTTIKHNRFGALGVYCRYAPVWNDSLPNDSVNYEGWLKFEKSNITFASNKKFKNIKLFYGYNQKPVIAELYVGEEMKQFHTLMSGKSIKVQNFIVENTPDEFKIKFTGKDSPDIYGISIESDAGILVDNIAMRGSAGLDFTRMNMTQQSQMYRLLNTNLLILQFGLNVVPNVVEDYTYYENWFYNQLSALKRFNPDMSIIVIGVSDMSRKKGEYYESYPNIEKIRDVQRNAAFKANCAFWDFYEAMGGENSMPSWVFAEPPLATKDFTHLNYKGARIIGQMFYNALIYEQNSYNKKH